MILLQGYGIKSFFFVHKYSLLVLKEFMASQGLTMGDPEELPPDPYTQERMLQTALHVTKTPPADDKLRRFLEYDGKILRY